MKISELNNGSNTIQYVSQAQSQEKQSTIHQTREKDPSLADRVEISSQSRDLKKINDLLETIPDVRAERVEEVKKLLQEGNYRVNSEDLAEKMIRESLLDLIV